MYCIEEFTGMCQSKYSKLEFEFEFESHNNGTHFSMFEYSEENRLKFWSLLFEFEFGFEINLNYHKQRENWAKKNGKWARREFSHIIHLFIHSSPMI